MKKTHSLLAAVVLTLVAGVASAFAQDAIVKVHVPFEFTVSSSTLPAGDYSFTKILPNTWTIQNDNTGKRQVMATSVTSYETAKDQSVGALVFRQFGSDYFLTQVRCNGGSTAVAVSKAERSMERETAQNGSKPQTVNVLVSAR